MFASPVCVRRASVDQYKDVVRGGSRRGGAIVCVCLCVGGWVCGWVVGGLEWTGVKLVRRNTRLRRPVDPVNGVYIIM